MSEPKLNDAVTGALAEILGINKGGHVVLKPLVRPITHGYLNRRMFLESFLVQAGAGVAIEKKDIIEYAGITEKEFDIILQEYKDNGVVLTVNNPWEDVDMYKLDTREVNKQATP